MSVKIVTDSTADLSPQLAQELGIAIVPVYVRFGEKSYRDGIDIGYDELYDKLVNSPIPPRPHNRLRQILLKSTMHFPRKPTK